MIFRACAPRLRPLRGSLRHGFPIADLWAIVPASREGNALTKISGNDGPRCPTRAIFFQES